MHFLQIWIDARTSAGITPGYEQKTFSDAEKRGKLRARRLARRRATAASRSTPTRRVYAGVLDAGDGGDARRSPPGAHAWVHVARGKVRVNGEALGEGDGVAISDERELAFVGVNEAEVLVFDLG